jgi:hypothetical protein
MKLIKIFNLNLALTREGGHTGTVEMEFGKSSEDELHVQILEEVPERSDETRSYSDIHSAGGLDDQFRGF